MENEKVDEKWLASRVEELENLIAKQSLTPELSSTQRDAGKREMIAKEIRLLEKFVENAAEESSELGRFCNGCGIQIDALDVSVRPAVLKPNIHKRGCFVAEAERLIEKEKQMAKGKKSFPKTLYAKWEDVGGEPWIGTFDKAENALEAGEQVSIATYELKEVRKGRLLPELK